MAHIYSQGCIFNQLEDIKDKHVTIMGLGLNGGGEACTKFFLQHGAFVTVTDMKTSEQLKPTIDSIASDSSLDLSRLTYVLGEHRMEDFENADCVIKNPGVKIEGNKYLSAAKAIETDISIFLHFTKAKIIAVTGSKGKSSTVSAIYAGLKACGKDAYLGGNITVSPLTFLDKTNIDSIVVLELSSWQLADLRGRKALKPSISIITKIVPDHQNWYGNMESYVEDKKLIYADQDEGDFTILDFDKDDYLTDCESPKEGISCWGELFASETKATVLRYSTTTLPKGVNGVFQAKTENDSIVGKCVIDGNESVIMETLKVPGPHMRINCLNACLCLKLLGIKDESIVKALGEWNGIEHRLEHFHSWNAKVDDRKVNFYNDSCATVPEAAAAAVLSFDQPTVLITGGTDKGLEFDVLAKTLSDKTNTNLPKEIYLLSGTGTDKLTPLLDSMNVKYEGPFDSLEVLLKVLRDSLNSDNSTNAYGIAKQNGCLNVIFSPGATSFGMFTNEFDRGNKFRNYTKQIFN